MATIDTSMPTSGTNVRRLDMRQQKSRWARLQYTARRYPQLIIGTVIMALFIIIGIGASQIAPYSYETQSLRDRLLPPFWSAGGTMDHPLGTDEFGRDTLSRLIYGARISLLVGFFSVLLAGVLGSIVGLISGYVGGNLDAFLMRLVDIQLSFPYILIAIVISAFWGADATHTERVWRARLSAHEGGDTTHCSSART